MNEVKNTYCYSLIDHDEVVRYGITTRLNYTENHWKRRKERGWIEYTAFIPDKKSLTSKEAKKEKSRKIREHEEKHGKKPRYNKMY